MTYAQDGEYDTVRYLTQAGLIYNWHGSIWCLTSTDQPDGFAYLPRKS